MAKRKVAVFHNAVSNSNADKKYDRVVKVYWDNEWEEFSAVLYVEGVKQVGATCYDTDKDSIMSTAASMAG